MNPLQFKEIHFISPYSLKGGCIYKADTKYGKVLVIYREHLLENKYETIYVDKNNTTYRLNLDIRTIPFSSIEEALVWIKRVAIEKERINSFYRR